MTTFYGGVSGANAWRTAIAFVDILPAFCLLGSILPLFYDFRAVMEEKAGHLPLDFWGR